LCALEVLCYRLKTPLAFCESNEIVVEANKRDSNVSKGKGAGPSAPTKEKPTKAERRATQEAQRAAKAAAKEAGNVYSGKHLRFRSDMFVRTLCQFVKLLDFY
jgi:hypothetical protein